MKSKISNSWMLPKKNIPIPLASSDQFRKILSAEKTPNIEENKRFTITEESFREGFIQELDGYTINEVEKLKKELKVSSEKEIIKGVTVRRLTPLKIDEQHTEHLFIHLHPGGHIFGGGEASIHEGILIAALANIEVISIDYRMPPTHPYPAGLEDVITIYKELLKKTSPENIAIGGSSAGGGLAFAAIHQLKVLNLDLPKAIFAGSPWVDLTKTGDSHFTNEGIDHILISYEGWLKEAAKFYAGENDLKKPLISPIYGDFTLFPPTHLVIGTRDLFLSDVVRAHRKLKQAGIIAELNVYEGLSHIDYLIYSNIPESKEIFKELNKFLKQYLK